MLLLIPGAISNSNAVIRQEFRKLRFQMIDDTRTVPTSRQTQNLNIIYRRFVLIVEGGNLRWVKLGCEPSPTRLLLSLRARQGKHRGCSSRLIVS